MAPASQGEPSGAGAVRDAAAPGVYAPAEHAAAQDAGGAAAGATRDGAEQGSAKAGDAAAAAAPGEMVVGGAYRIVRVVGEGAYGVVYAAVHIPSSTRVAVKRITPFDHQMFSLRTLREIRLLRHFHHENIISILDIVRPTSFESFTEVNLVQELMETDMHLSLIHI